MVVQYRRTAILLLAALVVVSLSGCCGNVPVTTTGDNSTPTVKASSAGQTAGKIAVPAQEWYAAARAVAQGWDPDVFLYTIAGSNKEGDLLPVDGKCREWSYDFISPSAKVIHSVTIRDGAVLSTDNTSLVNDSTWTKILSDPIFRINGWTVDSPEATKIANEQYKKTTGKEPSVQVVYILIRDYNSPDDCPTAWTISYDPSARLTDPSAPVISYKVNADTGSIINR